MFPWKYSSTKEFVLPTVLVCFVVASNVNWAVGGIETDTLSLPSLDQLDSSIPNLDDTQQLLVEKCQKNSKLNDSYDRLIDARYNFEVCVKSLIDVAELKTELDVAKPEGYVHEVFYKYCKKTPKLKECLLNFTAVLDECMDGSEKETKRIIINVVEALIAFVCHNDGDRLAFFYAEGGIECLMNKKEGIEHCINATFSQNVPNGTMQTSSNSPSFTFEEDQCKCVSKLQSCVVRVLEECQEPTPANLIHLLFNFVRRATPCSKFKRT